MIRVFRHFIPVTALFLAAGEALLFFAVLAALQAVATATHGTAGTLAMGVWIAPMLVAVMSSLGVYNRDVLFSLDTALVRAAIGVSLAVLTGWMAAFLAGKASAPPDRAVLLAIPGCLLVMALTRGLLVRLADSSRLERRILVVGDRAVLDKALATARGPSRRFSVVAFTGGQPMLQVVREKRVDEIVVVAEQTPRLPWSDLLDCRMNGVAVRDLASFCESEARFIDLDALHPGWLVYCDGFRMDRVRVLVKGVFDYAAALALLLLTLPVTVPTALAIRLTSPGPVFFRQERVGAGGKVFRVLKFRSMRLDAERDGPQWARADDDRVTRVGRFIRKVRIDEIPQVVNVLRGEMSFIGPRPERPVFVETLAQAVPYYRDRHRIKPGITGWAQVNYPYGASVEDARNKLSYDLYYLKNGSIFLDLVILAQTVRVVLFPAGAR